MNAPKPAATATMWSMEIRRQVEHSISVKQSLLADTQLLNQVERLSEACLQALRSGNKIIFAGNGGSFADAQHLAAEFTCRFMFDREPLASVALATNASAISAIANDYGYQHVFAREMQAIARTGDVFIPITTSGNSPNVLEAVAVAKSLGITTVGLSGGSGGKLKQACECICVPAIETARIQECHILLGHIVCGLVEAAFFTRKSG